MFTIIYVFDGEADLTRLRLPGIAARGTGCMALDLHGLELDREELHEEA